MRKTCSLNKLEAKVEFVTCKLVAELVCAMVEVEDKGTEVCAAFKEALVTTVIEFEDTIAEEDPKAVVTDGCANSDPVDENAAGFDDCEELCSYKFIHKDIREQNLPVSLWGPCFGSYDRDNDSSSRSPNHKRRYPYCHP